MTALQGGFQSPGRATGVGASHRRGEGLPSHQTTLPPPTPTSGDQPSPTVPAAEASLELEHRTMRQTEGTLGRHGPNPRKLASLQEDT